ncbi:putative superfamily III holin-X [Nocardiopsis sp. Huas11]|uniref:phage holin family protein n=1 Tax=Nocardiopsis sp. Huas11 TaxID=2183912 RepID=UPI000EB247D2|nr:phage holin family protein [Nocardiopsis sp. Huas11]RKS08367.1 putative superfamily III holin-X [Nocardiopsis sp. Huas11]
MTTVPRPSSPAMDTTGDDRSVAELVTEVTNDLQKLFRQEVELAKAEFREEATKAGKAAGMLSAAAFAGYMTLVLLSLAAVFGLSVLIGLGWASLVVAAVWAIAGAILFAMGRSRMRRVSPAPERTIETLKEDARWAKHPTG